MRIRTIKPEFWQSEDLAEISDRAKLLAIGLLNMADDEGYLKAHPAIIKSQLFPFNTGSLNIHGMLTELSNVGYISLLTGSDGKNYVLVNNFTKHQKVNRPSPSKIKASVEFIDNSLNTQGAITIGKEQGTGKGKEQGKGKEEASRFGEFWDLYGKKVGRDKCESKWEKLKQSDIEEIFTNLPSYVASTPDKQYRKDPLTWLNGKHWQDEIQVTGRQSNHNLQNITYESGDL